MSNRHSFFDRRPLFVLDHKTLDIVDVNESAVERYGYSREEFLSMNVNDLGTKRKRTELVGGLEADNSVDKIWKHSTRSGEEFYVQFTYHVFNHQGKPVKLVVAHEVTELVEDGERDRHRFPQVDTHRDNGPLAEIEWDPDKKVRTWSEKAEELFGWREEEVVGVEAFFDRFVHEEELEKAYQVIDQRYLTVRKPGYTIEGRVRTKSGKILICEWYNSMVYDEVGELVSINSLVHDISDRKESEYLFRALSEESLVGVYLIQDGIFKYVNPKLASIFHYKKEDIENKLSPMDLTHLDDRETVKTNIRRRLKGESKALEYDFRGVTRDGQIIHVNVYGTAITYFGKPAIIGTLLDITDTKLALRRYRASVESFQDLFDSISDAIYIQNRNGRFIEVNQSAVELNGYSKERLIGSTPDFLASDRVDLDEAHDYFQQALDGEVVEFTQWGKRKNGEVFPEKVILSPGTYFGEEVVIAISRDISAQHEVEEQLRKNEELFRQLFQNSPIAIAMMDENQEIRHVNESFVELFGYSAEEASGTDIDRLIVPDEDLRTGAASCPAPFSRALLPT
ncbi:MAG: PAS domain S-box protein [Balneolaceae bacterium]|nr:PAS domain S-box protein [Balneolaceae bacterium]